MRSVRSLTLTQDHTAGPGEESLRIPKGGFAWGLHPVATVNDLVSTPGTFKIYRPVCLKSTDRCEITLLGGLQERRTRGR